MPGLTLHLLEFENIDALQAAYKRVADQSEVENCLIEGEDLRIRFAARAGAGEALVERIYHLGGLVWCSQHPLEGN